MPRTQEQGSTLEGGPAVWDSGEFEAWELDDRAAWRPAGALPVRVRALGGESNGSYLDRLARGNGLALDRLLRGLGEGAFASEPDAAEIYFNQASAQLLSVVCGRPVEHLRRALPSLAPQRMLVQGPDPVWQWPWRRACTLVPACQLCAARHGAQGPVWLASADGWQVCARHGRWLDDGRRAGRGFVDLGPLPQVLAAHRERIALLLDFAPDIRTFSSWPMRLVWPHADGSDRTMVPDFFARRCDGAGLLVACPPADGSSRKWDAHQAVLGQVCVQADWHLATPQVPDSPAMAVLAMLGEYRTVPAPRPDLEKQLLEAFARPRPLEEAVASVGDPIALLP
ncbi:TniQ family protein [Streptomyces sp. NBC_00654]|uniref:TniQ family protein n=1 Tax=Streptomyces sp. NBC_00654 TaxID=2975799 RepID=UPI002250D650|nr:TniQ family protein [Streptomyces sp. NBC_00654]MCX4970556.1 TniQ family protein [Streptomyces sp. NBC_00654]